MFGNSLLICLYCLSLVRLEISLRPFSFKNHNHRLFSILFILFILGVPAMEVLVRMMVEGHACDRDSGLLVIGLYQQELRLPGLMQGHQVGWIDDKNWR